MLRKKILIIFFTLLIISLYFFFVDFRENKNSEKIQSETKTNIESSEDITYKSNIIEDVNYVTNDADGNEYIIRALKGEIDFNSPSILYLTEINALIKLKNSEYITISSDYGKYNSENFDTIFSKNVIINYLDNKITSEYVDFSLIRNSMIITRDVVYNNLETTLNADVIELDIKTKDAKIFMYENEKKVNIKSKN
tara:strand:- start:571 stop:1158 length:588 start_codon:yes stop_codon:yes gene_type:complete